MPKKLSAQTTHLKGLEDIQGKGVVAGSDAGVDECCVGVDVWRDAPAAHVSHQSQGLAQLLPLPTQTDHCTAM